jgi:hypothetical protein
MGILHATDLHGTRGDFTGWPILKKESFVAQFCSILSRHAMLGVTVSVLKDEYQAAATRSDRKRTVTPHAFSLNVVLDWLLADIRTGKRANEEGVRFILENGHKNNMEAKDNIDEVIRKFGLGDKIPPVSFASKASCRAIQAADLLAFYSRRHANALIRATTPQEWSRLMVDPGQMMKIIVETLPQRPSPPAGVRPGGMCVGPPYMLGSGITLTLYSTPISPRLSVLVRGAWGRGSRPVEAARRSRKGLR